MKKNWMLRLGLLAMVLTLVTMPMVSSTYAKYVTEDSGTATARVAKWGVVVEVTTDAVFAETYDTALAATSTVVSSVSGEDVLAPGTSGAFAGATITGAPEVNVNVNFEADLTLNGWTVVRAAKAYCPIVITVDGTDYTWSDYADLADFKAAVEAAIENLSDDYLAGTNLSGVYDGAYSWSWAFVTSAATDVSDYFVNTGLNAGAAAVGTFVSGTTYYDTLENAETNDGTGEIDTTGFVESGNYDVEDTALGDLGAAPTISLEITVTVTQIN